MERCTVIRWAYVAGLLFFCGCASTRTFAPGGTRASDGSASSSTADDQNPFKRSDSLASKDDPSKSDADDKAAGSSTASRRSPAGAKTASLDPEIRKLMEDELKSELPEERERLFNQWKRFDPAFIRVLVSSHRAVREVAESRKNQSIKLASSDPAQDLKGNTGELEAAVAKDSAVGPPDAPRTGKTSAAGPWNDSDGSRSTRIQLAANSPQSDSNPQDSFDSGPSPGQIERPIVISPRTPQRAATPGSPAATVERPAAGTAPHNATAAADDAFADDPSMGGAQPIPFGPPPGSSGAHANGLAGPTDPASMNAGLSGPPANGMTAGGSGASARPGGPASPGANVQTANATLPGSPQPVRLGAPTDSLGGPSSDVPADLTAATPGAKPAKSAAPPPAAPSAANAPSRLASLPGRLLGVINPGQNNAAARLAQSVNWHDELQKIVTAAAGEASQTSAGTTDAEKLAYIEKQVHLRMLYILAGQSARSLEPIAGLESADQEFWQQVFWGVANYFDASAIADPTDRATQTITQLRTAVHRLQEKSKLELHNVVFCHKIVNYGNYERFARDEFTAGQQVLLYAEVENFKSEATADGPYRTVLKSAIEISDSKGTLVQSMPFAPIPDLCASPRRDYYNSYEFVIPQRIGPGPHVLKLTVEDQLSRKVATYTVNFTVK